MVISDFDKKSFEKHLMQLGINQGNMLFLNCDLSSLGIYKGFRRLDYVNIFLDYLGKEGTLVALAYTGAGRSIFLNKNLPYFDGTQKAYTGAFSNIMLRHPNALRSSHPSNSIVAIGKHSEEITKKHTAQKGAYSFIDTLLEKDAKALLIGMSDFPGFVTHKVEEDLKLYTQYWDRFFYKVKLPNNKLFKRLDPGGCSSTFGRLYPYYIKEEKLKIGKVGKAYSLSMNIKDAYEIDKKTITSNPKILICDNPECYRCRISRWVTIWRLPVFVIKKIVSKAFKKLRG